MQLPDGVVNQLSLDLRNAFPDVKGFSSGNLYYMKEWYECQEPARYRLMTRLQFTYPGMGRNAGYLRSHIASANCTATDCIVEVPVADFVRKWNLSLNRYQVHCRYLLIDTQTGYRCNYKKMSFITAVN